MKKTFLLFLLGSLLAGCSYTGAKNESNNTELSVIGMLNDPVSSFEFGYFVKNVDIIKINGKEVNVVYPDTVNVYPGTKTIDIHCYGTHVDEYVTVKLHAVSSHKYLLYFRYGCKYVWVRDVTSGLDDILEIQLTE